MNGYWWAGCAVMGLLLATFGGTPVVRGLFRVVDWQSRRDRRRREAAVAGTPGPELIDLGLVGAEKDLPGGRWIGLLERAAVFACLISGFHTGIAVSMVIKGFGRYPELRSPDAATGERFIVGTMASLLWAALCAGAVMWLR